MNKGLTLVELLVTIMILGIVMLGISEYTFNTIKVTDKQAAQLGKAEQTRSSGTKIGSDVKRAAYIYPSNQQINLYIINKSYSKNPKRSSLNETQIYKNELVAINTTNALAMLIPTNEIDPTSHTQSTITNTYFIKVYFLENNKLYEFSSDSTVYWPKNTIPDSLFTVISGSANVIAENVIEEDSILTYYCNKGYSDQYDSVLDGSSNNVYNNNALIGGIEWKLYMESITGNDSYIIEVKGFSRNVPRYTQ